MLRSGQCKHSVIFSLFVFDETTSAKKLRFSRLLQPDFKEKTFQDMEVVCLTSANFRVLWCLVSDNQYCVLNKLLTRYWLTGTKMCPKGAL